MTAFKLNAEIDNAGNLKLVLPVGLPAGKAEVLVIVQTGAAPIANAQSTTKNGARSGLFFGKLNREIDIDAALEELNDKWKSKLTD